MSLISRIRDAFNREAPRALRNKPGGMAWVRIPAGDVWLKVGAGSLHNAAVKTLHLNANGNWVIAPKVSFVATRSFTSPDGEWHAGEVVTVGGLADECLEPWKDIPEADLIETDVEAPKHTKETA